MSERVEAAGIEPAQGFERLTEPPIHIREVDCASASRQQLLDSGVAGSGPNRVRAVGRTAG